MEEQISRIAAQVADRLFVEVEASGRHVHLTKDQAMTLFGHGLTPKRPSRDNSSAKSGWRSWGPRGAFPRWPSWDRSGRRDRWKSPSPTG